MTTETVAIAPPNIRTAEFLLIGTSPYVQHKFSKKAREQIMATQRAGSKSRSRKVREARDFDKDFEEAKHIAEEGWIGIPAPCFRNAMISACRTVGYVMTRAKLAVFVEADGFDRDDGMPLVRIDGEPEKHVAMARNETGVVDVRCRPMWREWSLKLRVQYDADMFSVEDVTNLLARVGMQVGIGEGRPDSKKSAGLGWGLFRIANEEEQRNAA